MPVPPHVNPIEGNQKYEMLKTLGSGAFGQVILARVRGTNEQAAIKVIERGDKINKYVEAEVLNHRRLCHEHVIGFKEVFLMEECVCIVMEYACGGNLFDYVKTCRRLKESAARWFFQQLVIGLDFCHRKGVVNRDIKLENTLLQNVEGLPIPLLKICDFGYSKAQYQSAPKSKVGTLAYMAPEVLKATGNYDGQASDIWSCGVMLYVMLFGQYPFESPQPREQEVAARRTQTMSRILNEQWSIPPEIQVSPECSDLLHKLLVRDPTKRISMREVLQHPWVLENLPPAALTMNDERMAIDHSGTQSDEEIKQLLASAQVPGPNNHNFAQANDLNQYDDQISRELEDSIGQSLEMIPGVAVITTGPEQVALTVNAMGQQQQMPQQAGPVQIL